MFGGGVCWLGSAPARILFLLNLHLVVVTSSLSSFISLSLFISLNVSPFSPPSLAFMAGLEPKVFDRETFKMGSFRSEKVMENEIR